MQLDAPAANRLFYRLKLQALLRDIRNHFDEETAWEIIAHAVKLENTSAPDSDRRQYDLA